MHAVHMLMSVAWPSRGAFTVLMCLQQHRFTYNEPMPVESCTQSLCDLALRFGEDGEEDTMVCNCSAHVVLTDLSTVRYIVPGGVHADAAWRQCCIGAVSL